jgi:hypothetical protein
MDHRTMPLTQRSKPPAGALKISELSADDVACEFAIAIESRSEGEVPRYKHAFKFSQPLTSPRL